MSSDYSASFPDLPSSTLEQDGRSSALVMKPEQSSMLSKTRMPRKSSKHESEMACCPMVQSGVMSELCQQHGLEALLAVLQQDSHVRISALLENSLDLAKTLAQDSFIRLSGLPVNAGAHLSSWKTYPESVQQLALLTMEESGQQPELLLKRWPEQGICIDGYIWPLKNVERHTEENDGGVLRQWRTPNLRDHHPQGPRLHRADRQTTLVDEVKNWSTPRASPNENRQTKPAPSQLLGKHGWNLSTEVHMWGSPRADEYKDSGDPDSHSHSHMLNRGYLCAQVKVAGEQLNPDWEELLMGWPIGWTDPSNKCAGVWAGWPMGQGNTQFEFEPSRTIQKGTMNNRTKRVEMCGNGVVPQCADIAYSILAGAL